MHSVFSLLLLRNLLLKIFEDLKKFSNHFYKWFLDIAVEFVFWYNNWTWLFFTNLKETDQNTSLNEFHSHGIQILNWKVWIDLYQAIFFPCIV